MLKEILEFLFPKEPPTIEPVTTIKKADYNDIGRFEELRRLAQIRRQIRRRLKT